VTVAADMSSVALGRSGQAAEVAELVTFLVSR
jgi:hypothetical protein